VKNYRRAAARRGIDGGRGGMELSSSGYRVRRAMALSISALAFLTYLYRPGRRFLPCLRSQPIAMCMMNSRLGVDTTRALSALWRKRWAVFRLLGSFARHFPAFVTHVCAPSVALT